MKYYQKKVIYKHDGLFGNYQYFHSKVYGHLMNNDSMLSNKGILTSYLAYSQFWKFSSWNYFG